MSQISLAQQMAHEADEFKVFQACVDKCLSIAETVEVMNEWNLIRIRLENRVFKQ